MELDELGEGVVVAGGSLPEPIEIFVLSKEGDALRVSGLGVQSGISYSGIHTADTARTLRSIPSLAPAATEHDGRPTRTSLRLPHADKPNNFWYRYNGSDFAIIFVHGIFSNSRTCWLHEEPSSKRAVFWPDLIRVDPRFDDPSIYLAGYFTRPDAGNFPIDQCARQVLDGLQQPDLAGNSPAFKKKNLVFVCHSTGGIVVRYMLCRHPFAFKGKNVGLALIASPSRGSVWANVAGLAAQYYNQSLGQQLRWHGEIIEDIHENFKDLIHRPDGPSGRGFNLFGMEACESKMIFRESIPMFIRIFLPTRLVVVTTESAGQYFQAVTKLPDTDHFSTVKPDGLTHPSHEFLEKFFREFKNNLKKKAVAETSGEPSNAGKSRPILTNEPSPLGPVGSVADVPNNLQPPLTSFVGRETELDQIAHSLAARLPRLLTLVGPGGSGKTRLALQAAVRAFETHTDGVWFVSLAEIRERDRIGPTIAAALGMQVKPDLGIEQQLARHFQGKRMLLVLDNFEQLTEGKHSVSELLRLAPLLTLIVTSRENLGLQGEREIPVQPLPIPPLRGRVSRFASRDALKADVILRYASVQLFMERAKDVRPDFTITDKNAFAVAEICVRLDGIPLAIELAAARIRMMSPEQLLARISKRFSLLSDGPTDLPSRQQTIRKTIDWSYDLLDQEEKRLFARLSVFRGGFTFEASEEVCEAPNAFELFTSLFDKSLIQRRETADGDRFTMLESVLEYAAEKLDDSRIYLRAAQYFLRRLDTLAVDSHGEQHYRAIDVEYDNLIHLVNFCFQIGQRHAADANEWLQPVVAVADALQDYLRARGFWDDAIALAEKAVIIHDQASDWPRAGRQMYTIAWVHLQRGILNLAEQCADRCKEYMLRGTDPDLACLPNHVMGLIALRRKEYAAARKHFLAALQCHPKGTGTGSKASIMMELGHVSRAQTNFEEAREWYDGALQENMRNASEEGVAICKGYLAALYEMTGDHQAAEASYMEALALALSVGRLTTVARCRIGIAGLLVRKGDAPGARTHISEAMEIYDRLHMHEEMDDVRRKFPTG